MRIVIESDHSERDAAHKLAASFGTTYSALFRTLLRMALDGTIPRKKLETALKDPRATLNVKLDRPKLNITLQQAPQPAQESKKNDDSPTTPEEKREIEWYLTKHPKAQVNIA